jgi:hypothetical protein
MSNDSITTNEFRNLSLMLLIGFLLGVISKKFFDEQIVYNFLLKEEIINSRLIEFEEVQGNTSPRIYYYQKSDQLIPYIRKELNEKKRNKLIEAREKYIIEASKSEF